MPVRRARNIGIRISQSPNIERASATRIGREEQDDERVLEGGAEEASRHRGDRAEDAVRDRHAEDVEEGEEEDARRSCRPPARRSS